MYKKITGTAGQIIRDGVDPLVDLVRLCLASCLRHVWESSYRNEVATAGVQIVGASILSSYDGCGQQERFLPLGAASVVRH